MTSTNLEQFKHRAARQIERAKQHRSHILLYSEDSYPTNLWASNNPVPVLYVRGDLEMLRNRKAVACVGSRNIRDEYVERQREFATFASKTGFVVVSGFALGADSVAHRAARDSGGSTVCVMPCGLDRPFPPENKGLWAEFNTYQGATLLSEFPFGTAAATLTLRKRNKTIVGLALGALVAQSSTKGGAMNAFRFAIEQRKPIATFSPNGTEDTGGNQMIVENSGTEFPVDQPSEQAWTAWLRTLSSSI
ncbi:MAG: DNA-protecting protein DprA [Actinomycetota bacterium]|nr:DNA-protecting protein DprA [Actinomycetota bacterium]